MGESLGRNVPECLEPAGIGSIVRVPAEKGGTPVAPSKPSGHGGEHQQSKAHSNHRGL